MTTTGAATRTRRLTATRAGLAPAQDTALRETVTRVLRRWPSVGLALAMVRDGQPIWFHSRGVSNVLTREPVTPDTVFRVGSLTKTFTAVAVMQLWEQGRIDLDAPANDYLTAFQLTRAAADIRPATVRHLLTHTAGVGYWRRLPDLLRPGYGSGVQARRLAPLRDYYRGGLLQEVQPGTKWVYSNHGFAALGQIVEDVTGQNLADYLRDNVFDPLGMHHTDLVLSGRVRDALAIGYVMRSRGPVPVAYREVPTPGGGGLYSTSADLARYVDSLLHEGRAGGGQSRKGGKGGQVGILQPGTVAIMFKPQFQPDPRLPGMGLGFNLGVESGLRTVGKDGVVAGFLGQLTLVPSQGLGVVALTNTGGLSAQGAAVPVGTALVREVLGLPRDPVRHDVAPRADVWPELCGWYAPAPGPITNLFTRVLMGAGAEVVVDGQQLVVKPLNPIPALRKGMPLIPDDPDDPYVFRVDLSQRGMGTLPVVFTGADDGTQIRRFWLDLMSFDKRPDARNPRRLAANIGAVTAAGAAGLTIRRRRRARTHEDLHRPGSER